MTRLLARTPLYDWHVNRGAKMVPFAGWEMPLHYTSQIAEHVRTRRAVSLFDVSHMGKLRITGSDALHFCDWLLPNRVLTLQMGNQCNYHPLCREDGTVVDDLILYPFTPEEILLCVNASNTEKDFRFIRDQATVYGFRGMIENDSSHYAQVAVQGPMAMVVVQHAYPAWKLDQLKRFRFVCPDTGWLVSRTGYTGEDGVEITFPPHESERLMDRIVRAAESCSVECGPAGLGARDTLRLEAGYPLYGHELDDRHTAIESGLAMFCDFAKGEFCGRSALLTQKEQGIAEQLIGLRATGPRAPRQGQKLQDDHGVECGYVVSGAYGPTVGVGIGTGFVSTQNVWEELAVVSPQGTLWVTPCALPFYSATIGSTTKGAENG